MSLLDLWARPRVRFLQGDVRAVLPTLPEKTFHCCVTSPPYFGLRDYGHDGQIGLEQTPQEYVDELVAVFREVRRVLRDDGTLWLNLGDSHVNKQLLGIPWRVAFALQADGWFLRQDIIWHKPNPMPEPAKDRCVKSHEYIFLFSKNSNYYFNYRSIQEPVSQTQGAQAWRKIFDANKQKKELLMKNEGYKSGNDGKRDTEATHRNKRSVWTVAPKPYKGAHMALMPCSLVESCILAGSPEGGHVLDPFGGAGTTGLVAQRLKRDATLVELNPAYVELARQRLQKG